MTRTDEELRWAELKRKEDAEKSHRKFINSLSFSESQLYEIEKELSSVSYKLDDLSLLKNLEHVNSVNEKLSTIQENLVGIKESNVNTIHFIESTNDLLKRVLIALIAIAIILIFKH